MTPWLRRLRARLRYRHFDRELAEEIDVHRALKEADLRNEGVAADEARYRTARELGNVLQAREAARGVWLAPWLEGVWQDARYALRQARRSPGFTLTVALVFGLGLGANTAIFSIVDATHLKPLPFREHWRLFDIEAVEQRGTAEETHYSGMSRRRLESWREQRHIFDSVEAYRSVQPMKLGDDGETALVSQVSAGLFPLLGNEPRLGRHLAAADATEAAVAVISDGLWKRAFGGVPGALGKQIRIGATLRTIVGVMPPGTRFPLGSAPDAWVPLDSVEDPGDAASRFLGVVARLRTGLTPATARSDLDNAADAIQQDSPPGRRWEVELVPLDPRSRPGAGVEQPLVLIVFGAMSLVVIAACASVANLLLSRAIGRRRELAIRGALGAGRGRILRQLLVGAGLPVLAGAVAAILLAAWLIRLIPWLLPPRTVWFPVDEPSLDLRVLLFAIASSVLVGLLSNLLPAVRGAQVSMPGQQLRSGAGQQGPGRDGRTRRALVAAQAALAVALSAGAGLMLNSFARMVTADSGFETEGLVGVAITLPGNRYPTRPAQAAVVDDLLQMVRSIPGVASATTGTPPPLNVWGRLVREGTEQDVAAKAPAPTTILYAGRTYFDALGIPILAGRAFSPEDRLGGPPVAVIDEDAARALWPGDDPLGKRLRYSHLVPWITVVGVAGSVKTQSVGAARDSMELYLPEEQQTRLQGTVLMARSRQGQESLLAAIRNRIQAVDPSVRVGLAGLVEEMYQPILATPRFTALLLTMFAALAIGAVSIGLYGALSYEVAGRSGEIGVRMALGAAPRSVRALVLRDAAMPVLAGSAVGCALAFWLTRFIAAHLYHVGPRDPLTAAAVLAVLVLVSLAAAYGPARRATMVDPVVALRAD